MVDSQKISLKSLNSILKLIFNLVRLFFISGCKNQKCTTKCIWPYSILLTPWLEHEYFHKLPEWESFKIQIFYNPLDFVKNLYRQKKDDYHPIGLRVVQSNFSAKTSTSKNSELVNKALSTIYKGIITTPLFVKLSSQYDSFQYVNNRNGPPIIIYRTNI